MATASDQALTMARQWLVRTVALRGRDGRQKAVPCRPSRGGIGHSAARLFGTGLFDQRDPATKDPVAGGMQQGLSCRGTEGLQTRRWREPDFELLVPSQG